MEIKSQRKQIYHYLCNTLASMQRMYRTVLIQLVREVSSSIPKDAEEVLRLNGFESQITLAETCIDNLEILKECFAVAYLSDGALSSEEEIISAMKMVDQFLDVTRLERENYGTDEVLISWIDTKDKQLNQVKDALSSILAHKLNHKNSLGALEKH